MISSSRRAHIHTRRGLIVFLLRPHFVFLPFSRFIFPPALRNAWHLGQQTLPKVVRLNPRWGLPRYEKRISHLAKYSLAHWPFKEAVDQESSSPPPPPRLSRANGPVHWQNREEKRGKEIERETKFIFISSKLQRESLRLSHGYISRLQQRDFCQRKYIVR